MRRRPLSKKLLLVSSFILLSAPFISSCELTENYMKHDRENSMEPQDYRDALAPRQADVDQAKEGRMARSGIPPLQPYVAQPDSNYKAMPLVSISINQTVPLRDAIYEIAEQAEYDVELDPRITGSIIFSARNRPLDMVIDRIAEIAGLRYKFQDDMLRVEIDTPYHEIYEINYLALTRTNTSEISNDISVVSGEGTDTGSSFTASNESVADFWGELETNLTQIVESNRDVNRLATERDPRVTVAESNPAPVEPIVMDDQGNIVESGPNVQVQAPDVALNVEQIAEEDTASGDEEDPFAARFSINRQAGLVSVLAPERLHKKVAAYMERLKKSVTSQVLIEAKVLEVTLNDEFSAGVDWTMLFNSAFGIGFGLQNDGNTPPGAFHGGFLQQFPATGLVRAVLPSSNSAYNSRAAFNRGSFSAAVDALARFGTVKALASPRLTVLNNQSAALNVAENVVFFEIETETTFDGGGAGATTTTSQARSVPEGVLINVQPAIDADAGRVSMSIRPTITTITTSVLDPANAGNFVPQVNVQEFDSIIQMNDGQAVVLGGLIQDRVETSRDKVPVLGEVPFLGGAFRAQADQIEKTELVVFLKATIVEGGNTIHPTDRDLYRTFSGDRRPFRL